MADPTRILIAVDGGGSGCRARVCQVSGQPIAQAESGPANLRSDFRGACENVVDAVARALAAGQVKPAQVATAAAWVGLAGAGRPEDAEAAGESIGRALGVGRIRVSTDCETTVEGALGQGDAVLALLGTGAFFAIRQGGRQRQVGGWGFVLGDQCGGAWLGHRLFRCVALAIDGLAGHSDLTRDISSRFDNDRQRLIAFAGQASPADFAAYAPRLVNAAQAGDAVAAAILDQSTGILVETLDRLETAAVGRLCLVGGLAQTYALRLPERYRRILVPAKGSALDGAVALARTLRPAADS